MTKTELNTLITLQEKWMREANRRGVNVEAVDKANKRVKLYMNEMLDQGFGPKTDHIHT